MIMIDVAELAEALGGPNAPVVLDARYNLVGRPGRDEFVEGHLPGARWLDVDRELSDPPGDRGRHPLPSADRLTAALRRVGVSEATEVVAMDGGDLLGAARLWWLLRDAGHDQVRVLDGGFRAWAAAGRPVVAGPDDPVRPGDFTAHPGRLPQVGPEEVRTAAGSVVDVRIRERWAGESEPIDPVAGHIPGAVNLPIGDLDSEHGGLRPAEELAERWAGVGEQPVIYCGSGLTASKAVLSLAVAGRADGVLYPGSWSEWIRDPDRPVATGDDD
ncbi:sulfurtransferase [Propionibacteriaceae bacterium Y2011]|uniref:sulfurtransferase n=1 Tax=Microlunatus sp. Y2014 TaxID=3418488 RepID=UPI003B482004